MLYAWIFWSSEMIWIYLESRDSLRGNLFGTFWWMVFESKTTSKSEWNRWWLRQVSLTPALGAVFSCGNNRSTNGLDGFLTEYILMKHVRIAWLFVQCFETLTIRGFSSWGHDETSWSFDCSLSATSWGVHSGACISASDGYHIPLEKKIQRVFLLI